MNEGKFSRRGVLRAGLLAVAVASSLGLAGCGGGEDSVPDPRLRFVNATINFDPAAFWVDGVLGVSNVAAGGTVVDYRWLFAGTRALAFGPSGGSAAVTTNHNFALDTYTTALALNGATGAGQFHILTENNPAAPSGQAKIRVLNATNAAGYNVYIQTNPPTGSDTPISVAGYNTLTEFVTFTSGSRRIYITSTNNTTPIFRSRDIPFNGTSVGTLAIVPNGNGGAINVVALPEQAPGERLANQP